VIGTADASWRRYLARAGPAVGCRPTRTPQGRISIHAGEQSGRLEIRHTPKHGSWLNIAENELSALTRQCVNGRRFAMISELRKETAAWRQYTNEKQRGVDWPFHIDDARTKLKSLYPKIKG
jgi:hypothetical protein